MTTGQSQDWLGLKDVVVVVTGAVGGIGQALVAGFVAAGAAVAAIDLAEDACRRTSLDLPDRRRRGDRCRLRRR